MLDRILKEHPSQVRLIFKDFPLDFHALARPAHEAARCAGESGKYWDYHDRLFDAQPKFSRDDLIRYAGELGLPRDRFSQCLVQGADRGGAQRERAAVNRSDETGDADYG